MLHSSLRDRMRHPKMLDKIYNAFLNWPALYHLITLFLSGGYWERWQNAVFDDLQGKEILEIGPGPGKLLLRLIEKGYHVTGVEFLPNMASEARRLMKQAGQKVTIHYQSPHKLPFKNETFDCIVATFVMSEINDLDKAIMEMKRILKKKGKVIIIAGSYPQDNNFMALLIFKIINISSVRPFDRDNARYLRKHGFDVSRKDFGPFNMINKVVAVKV